MGKLKNTHTEELLINDIAKLIEESKKYVANTINITLTMLYWKVGKRINEEILQHKRARYGEQIVGMLSLQLSEKYGRGWDIKTLRHCLRSAETFSEELIVSAVRRQLG
jgi:hypothetical protein